MSSIQQTLFGDADSRPHWSPDHLSLTKQDPSADASADVERNECWCVECRRRITIGSKEYGHDVSCSHSVAVEGGKQ